MSNCLKITPTSSWCGEETSTLDLCSKGSGSKSGGGPMGGTVIGGETEGKMPTGGSSATPKPDINENIKITLRVKAKYLFTKINS